MGTHKDHAPSLPGCTGLGLVSEYGGRILTTLPCPVIVPLDVRFRDSRSSALQALDEILYP